MSPTRESRRGQTLVIFALFLTSLIGMAALAIDVASVYAEQRHERSVADAASLAGASDMFRAGTKAVGPPEWQSGRLRAMQTLIGQLAPGDPLPACGGAAGIYPSDVVNCLVPGTPYYVSIFAPATSCASGGCDPLRSVQVTVRRPDYGLSFARLFGQDQWNLAITSVAERNVGADYTFVTLRPPKPSRAATGPCAPSCDANEEDVVLDGTNTRLTIRGDLGTNTNLVLKAGASVVLDPGSSVYHYDAYLAWTPPPPDQQLSGPIPDPGYAYPARPSPTDPALNFADLAQAKLANAACAALITADVPAAYAVDPSLTATGEVVCLKPGAYHFDPPGGAAVRTIVFTPGVYYFDEGLKPGTNVRVIGGYEAGEPGVAFVFKRRCTPACGFDGNAAPLVALNAGAAFPSGTGTPATAAINWDGSRVETNGPTPLPITLLVEKSTICVVAPTDNAACQAEANHNTQLKLPGGGSLYLFHVQYAPTDNVLISGGSGSNGFLGQIWAWTVQYTGGSNINLIGVSNPEPGVLRIATPCSPGATCVNPEAVATLP